jgi:hypothetical protein
MNTVTIPVPGGLLSSALWTDCACWRVWCWLVVRAAKKPRLVRCSGVPMLLDAGEAAAPLAEIARQTGLSDASVREALNAVHRLGFVEVRKTPWAVRMSIVV